MSESKIREMANQILKDHNLLRLPVDPLEVASALGIRVMHARFSEEDKSGVITNRGGQSTIYLNFNDSRSRKRFTVAHELGHSQLHMGGPDSEFVDAPDNYRSTPDGSEWSPERKREWEANTFAAELLMPAQLVKQAFTETNDLKRLAHLFQVSEAAMAIRLEVLKLSAVSE